MGRKGFIKTKLIFTIAGDKKRTDYITNWLHRYSEDIKKYLNKRKKKLSLSCLKTRYKDISPKSLINKFYDIEYSFDYPFKIAGWMLHDILKADLNLKKSERQKISNRLSELKKKGIICKEKRKGERYYWINDEILDFWNLPRLFDKKSELVKFYGTMAVVSSKNFQSFLDAMRKMTIERINLVDCKIHRILHVNNELQKEIQQIKQNAQAGGKVVKTA